MCPQFDSKADNFFEESLMAHPSACSERLFSQLVFLHFFFLLNKAGQMKLMWFRLIILNLGPVITVLLKYLTCYVALGIQRCVLNWKANRVHFVTKRHSFLQLKNCNVMLQVLHWKSTVFVKANNLKLSLERGSSCAWVSTCSNF